MKKVKVIVLRTAGTNCDYETEYAFQLANADVELVHINQLISRQKKLVDYKILAIPGGFSYGDDIASGKILANEVRYRLLDSLEKFVGAGKLVIGICNGFQVLVNMRLLPGFDDKIDKTQYSTLSFNDSGKFEARWIYLKNTNKSKCPFVHYKTKVGMIYLPIAHGEGKFITKNNKILEKIKNNDQIVFKYVMPNGKEGSYPWNPNGSNLAIAGICNARGNVLGMMPHPERFLTKYNHPHWTRGNLPEEGDGFAIFRNAVSYASDAL